MGTTTPFGTTTMSPDQFGLSPLTDVNATTSVTPGMNVSVTSPDPSAQSTVSAEEGAPPGSQMSVSVEPGIDTNAMAMDMTDATGSGLLGGTVSVDPGQGTQLGLSPTGLDPYGGDGFTVSVDPSDPGTTLGDSPYGGGYNTDTNAAVDAALGLGMGYGGTAAGQGFDALAGLDFGSTYGGGYNADAPSDANADAPSGPSDAPEGSDAY
jgi:hypothetical protein